jgi:hypothetical protein
MNILNFNVMHEEITRNNVLAMAECIAFTEVRFVTSLAGGKLQRMYSDLYADIKHKNNPNHIFSDGYDFVQTAALFLCEHFGKHLSDIMFYNKKGKAITIQILCGRQVLKAINRKTTAYKRNVSLDALTPVSEPKTEIKEEVKQDYTVYDKIVDSLNLTDNMKTALECRIAGLSYPEIGRILGRVQSTVFEYFIKMRQRYTAIYG